RPALAGCVFDAAASGPANLCRGIPDSARGTAERLRIILLDRSEGETARAVEQNVVRGDAGTRPQRSDPVLLIVECRRHASRCAKGSRVGAIAPRDIAFDTEDER